MTIIISTLMTGTGSRRWNDFTYMYSLAEKYKKWDGDTSNEWYNKNIIIMTKKYLHVNTTYANWIFVVYFCIRRSITQVAFHHNRKLSNSFIKAVFGTSILCSKIVYLVCKMSFWNKVHQNHWTSKDWKAK